MVEVAAVTLQDKEALLVIWPGLDAGDTGAQVDVSRYGQCQCRIFGTFADTDAMALQGAGEAVTSTGSVAGSFVTLKTKVESPFAGASVSATAAASFNVALNGVKWVKPVGGGSTGVGTSALNIVAMFSRPAQ